MKNQFCQSCGMPLSKEEDFGTNADGSLNAEQCVYCFKDGKYTHPDVTMDEMLKIGLKGIEENPDMNKFMKFLLKKMYPSQLKKLKRWNNAS